MKEEWLFPNAAVPVDTQTTLALLVEIKRLIDVVGGMALVQPEQCQCPNCKVTLHASDCAVHNEPAYPKGECNCGAQQYNATSDHQLMENAQGDLERIKLVQTGVGIGKPEQEPVAWKLVPIYPTDEMLKAMDECSKEGYDERLYAGHAASVYMAAVDVAPAPPQRTWVGLTDEEIDYYIVHRLSTATKDNLAALIRLCEARLKEKNA